MYYLRRKMGRRSMKFFFLQLMVFTAILLVVATLCIALNLPRLGSFRNLFRFWQFPCFDKAPPSTRYVIRGGRYYVLHDYFKAAKWFQCDESITYTTHGEWTYLDNLLPLLERWNGPVSIALYTPGSDFKETFQRIQYLRECNGTALVKDLVTFHLFFETENFPTSQFVSHNLTIPLNPGILPVNCTQLARQIETSSNISTVTTYRTSKNLTYPINVARNVARESSVTHFIFPSELELYPSSNLIHDFLEMVRRDETLLTPSKIFPMPVFEVEMNSTKIPETKDELVKLLNNGMATIFNKHICPTCFIIPQYEIWRNLPNRHGLRVFHTTKRGTYWKPMAIGTNDQPWYDERISWNGVGENFNHGFAMCLQDYEFHILDNAFLVQKPAYRSIYGYAVKNARIEETLQQLADNVYPELQMLFGNASKLDCDSVPR